MQDLIFRFACICLLSIVALTGCASKGSQFVGTWFNAHDPADTFQVERNGDEYLVVVKDDKLGAIYKPPDRRVASLGGLHLRQAD